MEYRNLKDNIYPEEFNQRAEGILNWIKENRGKEEWTLDPNAYEMTNVFLLGAKYGQEGIDVDKEVLKEMWEIRSQDFARCGVSENNFVYQICGDAFDAAQEGRALVNDEASHHALRSMADIGLFLNKQKAREGKVEFNNPSQLLELIEDARTLKGVHPELFVRYGFNENLHTLVRIQPENALSGKIQTAMNEIFEERTIDQMQDMNRDNVKERE